MFKRILLNSITSAVLLISPACYRETGYSPTSEVPTISVLERYEKGVEITMSDIPQLYDPSKLLIGSGVEYETTTLITIGRGEQKFTGGIGYRLKDVKSDNSGEFYLIEFYSSDGMNSVVELDRFAISHGLILDLRLARYLEFNYHRAGMPDFGRKMAAFLTTGLIGILIDELYNQKIEQSKKDYVKCLKEWSNKPKDPKKEGNKIAFCRKIGTEDLIVQSVKIACEIYEIQGIKKFQNIGTTSASPGECILGALIVCEWFNKVWISKDIPFGIVKAEITMIEQAIDNLRTSKTYKTFQAKKIQHN